MAAAGGEEPGPEAAGEELELTPAQLIRSLEQVAGPGAEPRGWGGGPVMAVFWGAGRARCRRRRSPPASRRPG